MFILYLCGSNVFPGQKPEIYIAGVQDYQPYSYMGKNGTEGLYSDIITELFLRVGNPVNIELQPFGRILQNTKDGTVTGMAGVYYTAERAEFAVYLLSIPLANIVPRMFVLKQGTVKSPDISALRGKLIGKKGGFLTSPVIDLAEKNGVLKLYDLKTTDQMVKMLLDKRLDAFIQAENHALYYIHKYDKNNLITMLKTPIASGRKTYLAFSKEALKKLPDDFIETVEDAFLTMKKDGTLEKINEKYMLIPE